MLVRSLPNTLYKVLGLQADASHISIRLYCICQHKIIVVRLGKRGHGAIAASDFAYPALVTTHFRLQPLEEHQEKMRMEYRPI